MKLQALLPLSAEMPSQSEEKVESDECIETAAAGEGAAGAAATATAAAVVSAAAATAAGEGVESTDAGDSMQQQEDEEDVNIKDAEVGGKKKGVRKKRSLNWEEAERGLLVEIIKSKVDFVENRCVDAKSIKTKRLSWMQITKQFNALNFRQRSLEQIQVQWRAMKNAAKREFQQKHPKDNILDGLRMVEYMEEMHKEPVIGRSHTRGHAGNTTLAASAEAPTSTTVKKELSDIEDDDDLDDTPLASLPTSTNTSEDTLQTSTIAIPSPPPSGDSQNEATTILGATLAAAKKKPGKPKGKTAINKSKQTELGDDMMPMTAATIKKMKRQRSQDTLSSDDQLQHGGEVAITRSHTITSPQSLPITTLTAAATNFTTLPADDKYKKQFYELIKRARLTEMDYARREHEQKMRFAQIEQEMKLNYYRQELELKLQQQRDEHAMRMRQQEAEHEARMRVYLQKTNPMPNGKRNDAIAEVNEVKAKPIMNSDNNERQELQQQQLLEQQEQQQQEQECN